MFDRDVNASVNLKQLVTAQTILPVARPSVTMGADGTGVASTLHSSGKLRLSESQSIGTRILSVRRKGGKTKEQQGDVITFEHFLNQSSVMRRCNSLQ